MQPGSYLTISHWSCLVGIEVGTWPDLADWSASPENFKLGTSLVSGASLTIFVGFSEIKLN